MSLLVRKIKRSKWPTASVAAASSLPADSLTNGCLRTQEQTLSTWRIDGIASLDRAVLAIAFSNDLVETFDLVCIEEDYLREQAIQLDDCPGETIEPLKNIHVDISQLDLEKLSIIAHHVSNQIVRDPSFCVRCSVKRIVDAVDSAIAGGVIQLVQIDAKYLAKLREKGLAY